MIIKNTQKKGISLTSKSGEIILDSEKLVILRNENTEKGSEYVITTAGEYEVEQISVAAYDPFPSVIIQIEQINTVFLPNPPAEYPKEILDELERVDILIVPGKRNDLVEKLAPLYVVPLDESTSMAEKLGVEIPEAIKSISIRSRDDLPEETQLINLVG